jgi:hypothetical protein
MCWPSEEHTLNFYKPPLNNAYGTGRASETS